MWRTHGCASSLNDKVNKIGSYQSFQSLPSVHSHAAPLAKGSLLTMLFHICICDQTKVLFFFIEMFLSSVFIF